MTEAEERIQDARETVVIRVKSLEAANVLLECAAKLVGALSVEAAEPPSPSEGEGPNPIPSEGEGKEGDDHG
jgi:hypothetical protein